MHIHTTSIRYHRDGDHLTMNREPWWTWLILKIVDLSCVATRHHWCNSPVMRWAMVLSDDHTVTFDVPATRELTAAYARWRGWQDDQDQDDQDQDAVEGEH